MNLYEDQFSPAHDFPRVELPSKTLIIASTARSGSHMLGHSLHQTGCFGFPLEYVNAFNLAEWQRRLGLADVRETLRELQRRRTSQNGVFGIKVHYAHLKQFGGFGGLNRFFPNPHYVLLSRKNVLRQAVSHSIAAQTGAWIHGQVPVHDEPRYDYRHIDRRLREAIEDTASWRYVLAASGSNFIEMDFDAAKQNIAQAVMRIAEFMAVQVDPQRVPAQPVTERQSTGINAEWERRFLADYDGQVLFDASYSGAAEVLKRRLKHLLRV